MIRPLEQRFWEKVKVSDAERCWDWQGAIGTSGYGNIVIKMKRSVSGKKINIMGAAHRISYEIHHGPIPENTEILHSCHNRKCVNPAHLRAGTKTENMRDRKYRMMKTSIPDLVDQAVEKLARLHASSDNQDIAAIINLLKNIKVAAST